MSIIQPFCLHESGAIGGVPGPNNGLWPGGITVFVNMDTMEVDHISQIGGQGDTSTETQEPFNQEEPISVDAMPEVTPVADLEEQNA